MTASPQPGTIRLLAALPKKKQDPLLPNSSSKTWIRVSAFRAGRTRPGRLHPHGRHHLSAPRVASRLGSGSGHGLPDNAAVNRPP